MSGRVLEVEADHPAPGRVEIGPVHDQSVDVRRDPPQDQGPQPVGEVDLLVGQHQGGLTGAQLMAAPRPTEVDDTVVPLEP